jgi:uridylate kinase
MSTPAYRRILLKLSGEALMGSGTHGIEPDILDQVAAEIGEVVALGVQVGVVIGGGNIFRGAPLAEAGMNRVVGDQMGMLATVMNALAMGDALERRGVPARVMSATPMHPVAEHYSARNAIAHLEAGRVALFSGGTGNPFFTTDSAASLRAIEIGADIMFKATKVDGVYDADPVKNPNARRYDRLGYDEVLAQRLGVMDLTAILLCQEHSMPLGVFNMTVPGNLKKAVSGEGIGTVIS